MRLQCVKHLQTKIRPIAPYLAIFGSLNPRVLFPVSKAFEHGYPVPTNVVVNYDQHWVHQELQLDRNMDTILLTYFKISVQPNYSMYMYAEDLPKHSLTIEEEDHIRYSDLFKAI